MGDYIGDYYRGTRSLDISSYRCLMDATRMISADDGSNIALKKMRAQKHTPKAKHPRHIPYVCYLVSVISRPSKTLKRRCHAVPNRSNSGLNNQETI